MTPDETFDFVHSLWGTYTLTPPGKVISEYERRLSPYLLADVRRATDQISRAGNRTKPPRPEEILGVLEAHTKAYSPRDVEPMKDTLMAAVRDGLVPVVEWIQPNVPERSARFSWALEKRELCDIGEGKVTIAGITFPRYYRTHGAEHHVRRQQAEDEGR